MKNEILDRQLAWDYCCTPAQAAGPEHVFSVYSPHPQRRKLLEPAEPPILKVACLHGKLLMTGAPEMIAWCRETYAHTDAAWFMEQRTLRELDAKLGEQGWRIGSAHPFYIPAFAAPSAVPVRCPGGYAVAWYEREQIEAFRGDVRFGEAYAFCPDAPDMLGVSLSQNGCLLAMAGASRDSETMYQIGVNVLEQGRGQGLGALVVALLKEELLRRGVLPFYGTAMSHIRSQQVAARAGFLPAWAELYAEKIKP